MIELIELIPNFVHSRQDQGPAVLVPEMSPQYLAPWVVETPELDVARVSRLKKGHVIS